MVFSGQKCCVNVHGVFPYIIVRAGAQFTPQLARALRTKIGAIVVENNPRRKFNVDWAIYEIKPLITK